MKNILILSPHLDDAIFSMSNFLLDYKGNATIITFFTEEHDFKHLSKDYKLYGDMVTRKEEDNSAIKLLTQLNKNINVNKIYLNLPDKLFRNFCYSNIYGKVLTNLLNATKNKLYDKIYCPLGIGEHPDHLLVYSACNKAFNINLVSYYCEFPYSNIKLNICKRLLSLGYKYDNKISFQDLYNYYNDPIYNSTPKIIRLTRISLIYSSYILSCCKFRKIDISNIKSSSVEKKYKLLSSYRTQIRPIFGNNDNLYKLVTNSNYEYYINI